MAGGAVFCRITSFLVFRIESNEDGHSIVSSCALTKSLRAASALKPFASRIIRNKDKVENELVRMMYYLSNERLFVVQKTGKILIAIEVKLQNKENNFTRNFIRSIFQHCPTVCAIQWHAVGPSVFQASLNSKGSKREDHAIRGE